MSETIKNRLSYGYGAPAIEKGKFKVSPSSMHQFFGTTNVWFREQFMGEQGFIGNTASIRGTWAHWMAECYGSRQEVTLEEENEATNYVNEESVVANRKLEKQAAKNPDWNIKMVNKNEIFLTGPQLRDALFKWLDEHPVDKTEHYIRHDLSDNVIIQGQVDYIRRDNGRVIVGDYKTSDPKGTAPKKAESKHIMQAMNYAYALEQEGTHIDAVEILYASAPRIGALGKTGKPLPDWPPLITSFIIPYNDDTRKIIQGQLFLMRDTMELFFKQPELGYILFQDYRLKTNAFDVSDYISSSEELF